MNSSYVSIASIFRSFVLFSDFYFWTSSVDRAAIKFLKRKTECIKRDEMITLYDLSGVGDGGGGSSGSGSGCGKRNRKFSSISIF